MVTLFGGTGYLGSWYRQQHGAVLQPRDDLRPQGPKVLYMISTTHNHHLPANPYIDVDVNIMHLIRVLEQARSVANIEFNFVSSWFVYGAVGQAVDERAPCDPQGFYSITKRTAEQLLMEYCRVHDIPWRILRLCNVIGAKDPGASTKKNILHTMSQRLRHHEPITLVNRGDFLRDYLHVSDACDAIDTVITRGEINKIYNIGSGHSIRFHQAIDYVRERTQSRSETVLETRFDVVDCILDCDRLSRLGWRPQLTWRQAIDSMLTEI
jgi:nucleoside-diphosphate-sugar epimerase